MGIVGLRTHSGTMPFGIVLFSFGTT